MSKREREINRYKIAISADEMERKEQTDRIDSRKNRERGEGESWRDIEPNPD